MKDILTAEGEKIERTVVRAVSEDITIYDVDRVEVSRQKYNPSDIADLDDPGNDGIEDHIDEDEITYYQLTVQVDDGVLTGSAIRCPFEETYGTGAQVAVEVYRDGVEE